MRNCQALARGVIAAILLSLASAAPAEIQIDSTGAVAERLRETAAKLAQLSGMLDLSEVELSPKVAQLEFDEHAIVEFVARGIQFDPYDGLLRGALGTLSAGAGNALDQSVLLAALLEEAGLEAQILEVDATPKELVTLLAQAAFAQPSRRHATPTDSSSEVSLEDIESAASALTEPVAPADPHPAVRAAAEKLIQGVTDVGQPLTFGRYHWVRYRLASGMPWETTHPALGGQAAPPLEPDRVLRSVDADQLHMLRIELHAEVLDRGQLRREPLMSPWQRPVPELFDVPLSVALVVSDPPEEATAGTVISPRLNEEIPAGAILMNFMGMSLDARVLEMGASESQVGLFSTLGTQLQVATETVEDEDPERPSRALTGVILEFVWIMPDGRRRAEERWLFDRVANREAKDDAPRIDLVHSPATMATAIGFQRDIAIAPGGANSVAHTKRALDSFGLRLRYSAMLLDAASRADESPELTDIPPLPPVHLPALLQLQGNMDIPIAVPADHRVYRHGPLLASFHRSGDRAGKSTVSYFDVLFNPWQGIRLNDTALLAWPSGAVMRGTHDTAVEVALGGGGEEHDYLLRLERQGITWIRDSSKIEKWPEDAKTASTRDLAQGFALLALAERPGEPILWWRVSPDGGEVLGRSAHGGASPTLEYNMTMLNNTWALASWTLSAQGCNQSYTGNARICCLAAQTAYSAGTFLTGAGVGQAAKQLDVVYSAGSAIFDLLFNAMTEVVGYVAGEPVVSVACGPPNK